jgi:GTP-binding protein
MGAGMGDRFLQHVERTRVLLHLIDPSPLLSPGPEERFDIIMAELDSYASDLLEKPMIAVITKMDLPENQAAAKELRPFLEGKSLPVHEISSLTGEGLKDLVSHAARLLKGTGKRDD